MKIEVKREEIRNSAALLEQLERWEEFLKAISNNCYHYKLSDAGQIVQGASGCRYTSTGRNLQEKVAIEISHVIHRKFNDIANEVVKILQDNIPLPLQK